MTMPERFCNSFASLLRALWQSLRSCWTTLRAGDSLSCPAAFGFKRTRLRRPCFGQGLKQARFETQVGLRQGKPVLRDSAQTVQQRTNNNTVFVSARATAHDLAVPEDTCLSQTRQNCTPCFRQSFPMTPTENLKPAACLMPGRNCRKGDPGLRHRDCGDTAK